MIYGVDCDCGVDELGYEISLSAIRELLQSSSGRLDCKEEILDLDGCCVVFFHQGGCAIKFSRRQKRTGALRLNDLSNLRRGRGNSVRSRAALNPTRANSAALDTRVRICRREWRYTYWSVTIVCCRSKNAVLESVMTLGMI